MTNHNSIVNWSIAEIANKLQEQNSWLKSISKQSLRTLLRSGDAVLLKDGTKVATRIKPCTAVYIILTGGIRVYSTSSQGKEYLVAILEPGNVFGLLGSFDGKPNPHDATSHGDTCALKIPDRNFRRLIDENAELRKLLVNLFCERLRSCFQVLEDFATKSPRSRLAGRLLALSAAYGYEGTDGVVLGIKITQNALGAMASVSRQRTNMYLHDMEHAGILTLNNGQVALLDLDQLRVIAEESE